MLFIVEESAINSTDAIYDHLDQIVSRVEQGVHELHIEAADLLTDSAWYSSCRSGKKKLLDEVARSSAYRGKGASGPHNIHHHIRCEKSARRARNDAYTPLTILLENRFTDGALVKASLHVLATSEAKEICLGEPAQIEPPSVVFTSSGGNGEICKIIDQHIEESIARNRSVRLVVITDCDGEWPGDVKQHAKDIKDYCQKNSIPCPNLKKRTAENYIPDIIIAEWSKICKANKNAAQCLISLTPEQRDHVNFGKSSDPPWDTNKPQVSALYLNVQPSAFKILTDTSTKGKGKGFTVLLMEKHRNPITPASIRQRDPGGELQSMVRAIEEQL